MRSLKCLHVIIAVGLQSFSRSSTIVVAEHAELRFTRSFITRGMY
jgi:hypothetical protein